MVLSRNFHFDNVFVAGQHRLGLRQRAHTGHIDHTYIVNQRRIPLQAWIYDALKLTKPQHNAALGLIHEVEAHCSPNSQRNNNQQAWQRERVAVLITTATTGFLAAAFFAATQHAVELVLKLFQRFIQVRWTLVVTPFIAVVAAAIITATVSIAVVSTASAATTPRVVLVATTRLIPGHTSSPLRYSLTLMASHLGGTTAF